VLLERGGEADRGGREEKKKIQLARKNKVGEREKGRKKKKSEFVRRITESGEKGKECLRKGPRKKRSGRRSIAKMSKGGGDR